MLLTELNAPHLEGYLPCNPSIASGPEGYAVIVTYRDLVRHDDGRHSFADESGTIRTRNLFSLLNDDLWPLGWQELPPPDVPIKFPRVRGVEDPRLFWNGEWLYTGSITEHHANGQPRTALCNLGGLVTIFDAPEGEAVKNLMPTRGDLIDVLPSDPTLHGGAVTEDGGTFLGIVHEVHWPGRVYHHRWARFSTSGVLVELSDRFTFGQRPIEFAAGIVLHRGDVVVSFGVQDQRALLARFSYGEVVSSLRPVGG